jgi:hypothetical protein
VSGKRSIAHRAGAPEEIAVSDGTPTGGAPRLRISVVIPSWRDAESLAVLVPALAKLSASRRSSSSMRRRSAGRSSSRFNTARSAEVLRAKSRRADERRRDVRERRLWCCFNMPTLS